MKDFFIYRWQCSDFGDWIDSRSPDPANPGIRPLPPKERHKPDWCQCILCRPDRYWRKDE